VTIDMNELLAKLFERSGALDAAGQWPAEQFALLAQAGLLGWVIPRQYGGREVTERELLEGYIDLASACLTTTFVLTQRNGACQRIAGSPNDELKADLLPKLARGELFATVGISHLTTSRQHLRLPAVQVTEVKAGFCFDGEVPWVTGAAHADFLVTGGTLADDRQVLAAIPAKLPGIVIAPPTRLLALSASYTSSMRLERVIVDRRFLIAGPVEQVMKKGASSTGSLGTSALAVGLSRAAIGRLSAEASVRLDLAPIVEPLKEECTALHAALAVAVEGAGTAGADDPAFSSETIRARANSLALRSTQACLAASKGAGFVSGHFAERAVREAMFFLVWSCPQPVVAAALRELAGCTSGF
jgi:alkylation response protein AidB-like acyl-CoA dehydrogenase